MKIFLFSLLNPSNVIFINMKPANKETYEIIVNMSLVSALASDVRIIPDTVRPSIILPGKLIKPPMNTRIEEINR